MDLLQLEHFLAVLEERTFTRAAERVSRTQSAISQSIKKLEEEIGTPLFARDVGDTPLTEAGKVLAGYARRMVRARDQAMRHIGALRDLRAGTLKIAAPEYAAVYLLRGPLHAYLARFPDIKIGIYRSRLTHIPRQVLDREVQLGFVEDTPAFHELKAVEVHSDQMVLVASSRHPLAACPQVRLRDLDGESFVLRRPVGATEQAIVRLFLANRAHCRVVAELSSFENVKSFVRENIGLAIVPRMTVRQELRDRTLVAIPLRELNLRQRTLMIYRGQSGLSDSARELVTMIRAFQWEAETWSVTDDGREGLRSRAAARDAEAGSGT